MKLMIVDDHPATRKMIRQLLDAPGVTFCECACGEEAVQRVNDFHPDWITLDIHMPGLNGFKTAAEIKKRNPQCRIAMVTADNQPYLRGMAVLAGASRYVSKENLIELRTLIVTTETEVAPPPSPKADTSSPCRL